MEYNTISGLSKLMDLQLDSASATITDACTASPTTYGVTTAISLEMAQAYSAYNLAMQSIKAADIAYRSAVQAKASAREELLEKFSLYLPMCYANPNVTNDELAQLGLAPRAPRATSVPVYTPLDLLATPVANNAAVNLKWKRNGNTANTTFIVEKKILDGAWELEWSGTRSKVEIEGVPAGEETAFRVRATKGDLKSNYSNVITVYGDGESATLQIAA